MSLKAIRKKYSEYGDLSDNELLKRIHRKHYADMSFLEFKRRIGIEDPPEPPKPQVKKVVHEKTKIVKLKDGKASKEIIDNLLNLVAKQEINRDLMDHIMKMLVHLNKKETAVTLNAPQPETVKAWSVVVTERDRSGRIKEIEMKGRS
jgi:hypothetical protein